MKQSENLIDTAKHRLPLSDWADGKFGTITVTESDMETFVQEVKWTI
jgi:hypothetical protein